MAGEENVVILRGRHHCVIRDEVTAVDDIKPGHTVATLTAGANAGKIDHAAADSISVAIALDRPVMGKKVTDAYAADQQIQVAELAIGTEFWGWVKDNNARVKGVLMAILQDGEWANTTDATKVRAVLLEAHTANAAAVRRKLRRI